jgi:hypothetical protein
MALTTSIEADRSRTLRLAAAAARFVHNSSLHCTALITWNACIITLVIVLMAGASCSSVAHTHRFTSSSTRTCPAT